MLPLNSISYNDSVVLKKAGYAAIYIVGFQGEPDGSPVKVGNAGEVHSRLHNLQTANWRPMGLHEILFIRRTLGEIKMRRLTCGLDPMEGFEDDSLNILTIESSVHRSLKDAGMHVSGEWFSGPIADIIRIAKSTLADLEIEFDTCSAMSRRLRMWKIEADEIEARRAISSSPLSSVRSLVDRQLSRSKRYGQTKARY